MVLAVEAVAEIREHHRIRPAVLVGEKVEIQVVAVLRVLPTQAAVAVALPLTQVGLSVPQMVGPVMLA